MSYAKKLTPDANAIIGPILGKILNMKPDQTLLLTSPTPAHRETTRSHLYSYFNRNNLTAVYRLHRQGLTKLLVVCRVLVAPTISSTDTIILSKAGQFYLEHLMNIKDEAEALTLIQASLKADEITHDEVLAIAEEWRRQNGLKNEDKLSPEAQEALNKMSNKSFLDTLG